MKGDWHLKTIDFLSDTWVHEPNQTKIAFINELIDYIAEDAILILRHLSVKMLMDQHKMFD